MRDAFSALMFRRLVIFRRSPIDDLSMLARALVGGVAVYWFARTYAPNDQNFVVASFIVFTWVSNIVIGTCFEVANDLRSSAFLTVMMARFNPFWYFFAQGVQQAVSWSAQALLLAVIFLFPSIGLGGLAWFVASAFLSFAGVFGTAAILAMWTSKYRWFYYASTVSGFMLTFAGALYPLTVFPRWLQIASLANPFTHYVDLMRSALTGTPTLIPVGWQLVVVCASGAALSTLGVFACRRLTADVQLRT